MLCTAEALLESRRQDPVYAVFRVPLIPDFPMPCTQNRLPEGRRGNKKRQEAGGQGLCGVRKILSTCFVARSEFTRSSQKTRITVGS